MKVLGWIEILVAALLFVASLFPFTRYCEGRLLGLDCESQAIFAMNMVGPLCAFFLLCGIWLLRTRSLASQVVLGVGFAAIMGRFLYYVF
jgi:hypothetical protein